MPLCSNCNDTLFSSQIQDSPLILEKLRWESGPGSIPNPDKVLPIIQSAQQELEDCDKQIKALESRKRSLLEYTAQLQSLFSPIRRVPDEILQHIFDDCCDMNHFTVDNHKKTSNAIRNAPALAVSSVCSRWRRNGLSMPGIWSRISLASARYDIVEDYTALEIALNRTLQHPLTIVIDLSPMISRYVLTLLFKHMDRWHSFTDKYQDSFLGALLHRDPDLKFPLLEDLDMVQVGEADLKTIAHASPKLKKLSITFTPTIQTSPFAQLLHLELYQLSIPKIQALFRRSHHLVSLKTEESLLDLEDSSSPPSSCRTIDTLTVYLNFDPRLMQESRSVLRYLTLPSLKAIHLEPSRKPTVEYVRQRNRFNDTFMIFLSRSSCPLTTLSIESLGLADMDLIDLVNHLPTLHNLSIDDSYVAPGCSPITTRFIDSLQIHDTDSNRPIVPRLHSLKLNVSSSTFNNGLVVDMVRSRWIPEKLDACASRESGRQVDRLREFTIKFRNREEKKGVYEPLEDVERDGMRAVVLWKNQ